MLEIADLKFDEKGLIPVVVQDVDSKKVLTVAYMNQESLELQLELILFHQILNLQFLTMVTPLSLKFVLVLRLA